MAGSEPGTWPRMLRLGLAAGAASLGAIGVSVLLGGSAAYAADDDLGPVSGLLTDVVGTVDLVTEPVDSLVGELSTVTAPVEAIVEPAVAPVAVVGAVVELPSGLVDAVRPVTGAVQPVLEPLAPITRPVGQLVDIVRDEALVPVVGTVDRTVAELPLIDGLLGEQPVARILDPVVGIVDQTVQGTIPPLPEPIGTMPGTDAREAPAIAPAPKAADASVDSPAGERAETVPFDRRVAALAVVEPVPPMMLAPADAELVRPTGAELVRPTGAEPSAADAELVRPTGAEPSAVVPAGASGAAGAGAGPQFSITSSHRLPQLAAGAIRAAESDRIPDAPVEEHTARPD